MSDELRLNDPLPEPVIQAGRALYAPPRGDAYWPSLEARIMARIADSASGQWWAVVGGWARSSLAVAAAAVVAAVVGLMLLHARNQELRTAYESATQPAIADSIAIPSGALSERDGPDTRGATFRDVISQ